MKRTLYILSGAGDPENDLYRKAYDLIRSHAIKLGYGDIVTQGWPGQKSFPGEGVLNQAHSVDLAVELLKAAEDNGVKYDVICRSYGNTVFLDACRHIRLNGIGFASLWGISAYSEIYRLFVDQLEATILYSKDKGVSVDQTFFPTVVPARILLERFDQPFQLNVLWGSLEKYCPRSYMQYLRESNGLPNIRFQIIEGLEHEVVHDSGVYLSALFNQFGN